MSPQKWWYDSYNKTNLFKWSLLKLSAFYTMEQQKQRKKSFGYKLL